MVAVEAQTRERVDGFSPVVDRRIAALEAGATNPPKRRPLEMTRLLLGAEQRDREHVLEVLIAGSSAAAARMTVRSPAHSAR